jgi:hypothetical protein
MPRIAGIAGTHLAWQGDRVAAVVGAGLIRAGIAQASSWPDAKNGTIAFVRSEIEAFIGRRGGASIRETFRLHTLLTGSLNDLSSNDREVDAARPYLTVEPSEAGYVELGHAVKLLEGEHPRRPATLLHLFLGALNRWIRVYDYRDAREHIERLPDWYSADPDSESVDLPDVEASVPACLGERPHSRRRLRALLPSFIER